MTYEEFKKRYIYDIHTDLLGEGGFGRVYKAYDSYEHENVALKMQSVNPNCPELRLRNEVDKVAQYVHKNIARYKTCYTFSSLDGELDVAVMKYYNDGNLHSLMRRGLLGNVERSSMLREILDGIAFLHSHDIIHRDLKPQNILVVKYQNEYCPLITDFGISKKLEEGQSSSVFNSFMGGTFEYASPEQLAASSIRKNVDLWSFGVIVYQMFTGELPFNCGNFNPTSKEGYAELFRQISSGVLPDKVNSIPEPWQTIVRRCIVVDNEVRLAHAEDCLRILDNYAKTDSGDTVGSVEVVDVVTPEPTPVQPPKPEPKPEPREEPKPAETPKTPTPAPKKSSKAWLWITLGVLLVVGCVGGWYLYNENKKQQREESVIELLSGEEVNDENVENQILISEDTNVLKSGVVACDATIDSSGRVVMCRISSQETSTIDMDLRMMCIKYVENQHFAVKTEGGYIVICNVKQYGSGEYKCEVQSIIQKYQTQSTTPQNTNEDSIRIAEEKRIAEQKAQEEAARKAEQQRIAEQKVKEETARKAEEKRIAEINDIIQQNDEIWYTTSDGKPIKPKSSAFDVKIISNTYENGRGVIKFDGNVTSIWEEAFENCESLTNITIPNSVTSIGSWAFNGCSKLKEFRGKYASDGGRCLIKDNDIIAYAEASGTSYTIPNGVTSINSYAFENCESLTNITIPNSVTSINSYAFKNCESLTNITIPNSVTSIGGWAFYGCTSLTDITIPNSVTSMGDAPFLECHNMKEFRGKYASDGGRCLIKDNAIIAYAYASGTNYDIPYGVTSIGWAVFSHCESLATITIPNSVTSISAWAFCDCNSLTNITIPNSVTSIGYHAFDSCKNLISITIPNGLTSIASAILKDCAKLTTVYIKATTPPSREYDIFTGCDQLASIYVPRNSVEKYKSDANWKMWAELIKPYDF